MRTPWMTSIATRRHAALLLVVVAGACGGGEDAPAEDRAPAATAAAGGGELSDEELRYGIGPVRDLELATIDAELAGQGAEVFALKCSACHKLEERYVGPPLAGVLDRRTPEFVMNMMLNPDEMVARHPEVKALLAQYFTPMPDQQLTREDARAVLEFLRSPTTVEDVDVGADDIE